jgi:hypothetical protein
MTIIVLITSGKSKDRPDEVTVKLFSTLGAAKRHCSCINTGYEKYWTKAEIVLDGVKEELSWPEE